MNQYETENHYRLYKHLHEPGKHAYRVISRAEARRSWLSLALGIAAFILPTAF
jgi:hypothetical protein